MEWFHGATQQNHKVVSSFWLLCKTSEKKKWPEGRAQVKKKKKKDNKTVAFDPICVLKTSKTHKEECEGNRRCFCEAKTAINPIKLGENGNNTLPCKENAKEEAFASTTNKESKDLRQGQKSTFLRYAVSHPKPGQTLKRSSCPCTPPLHQVSWTPAW